MIPDITVQICQHLAQPEGSLRSLYTMHEQLSLTLQTFGSLSTPSVFDYAAYTALEMHDEHPTQT